MINLGDRYTISKMLKRRIVFKRIGYRIVLLGLVVLGILFVRSDLNTPTRPSVFYVEISPPMETEAGERDLSQYDYGGHIGNCAAIYYGDEEEKGERCFEELKQARTFIEEHFDKRRRGYVIIDSATIDAIGTSYVFIEPDGTGDGWEIRIRRRVPGPYTRFHRNVNTWYYTEVFRRRIQEGDLYLKAGTSALVLRSRGVYELIF